MIVNPRLKETAYHEAGHFVVSSLMNVTVTRATIEPEIDTLGKVTQYTLRPEILMDSPKSLCVEVDRLCLTLLSGPIAEGREWDGDEFYDEAAWDETCDFAKILEYAEMAWGEESGWRITYLIDAANAILGTNEVKSAIEIVAQALLQNVTIEGEAVEELENQFMPLVMDSSSMAWDYIHNFDGHKALMPTP